MVNADGMVIFAELTPSEWELLDKIAGRAEALAGESGIDLDRMLLEMDLTSVHAHTPLDLAALAEADSFNLSHDVFGIMRHINRETGELSGHFLPRFTKREASA